MTPERRRQIEVLYIAAREHGPGVLASTDPELRREVEELLALDPSGARSMEKPVAELAGDSTLSMVIVGSQLGPYKIETSLGQGGMGQVFRATDTRLGRAVAIKVAHEKFNDRFDREARAIASLNHPNICVLHDVGPDYLVMELLEGETLAARLKRGKLSIQETLRCGAQIADALAAAHAKGITHRDLKPGNIMLGPFGVKVLDFGLAKMQRDAALTATNAVVGTPAYMAPEQIDGQECDARTDIYSLGLVLYEMVTGRRASDQPSFAGILDKLAQVIEHCLRKDPARRFQRAEDVKTMLEELEAEFDALSHTRKFRSWRIGAALAGALAIASATTLWWTQSRRGADAPSEAPVVRLTPENGFSVTPAISPDGKLVAYASDRATGENLDIWVQQIDGGSPIRLTSGSNSEMDPSFSPDGSRIVYRSDDNDGELYTIPALGGEPRFLAPGGRHARFSPDGAQIAYATGLGSSTNSVAAGAELFVIPSMGGTPRKLVSEIGATHPIWSPDGKWILFAVGNVYVDQWAIIPSNLAETVNAQQYGKAFEKGQAGSLAVLNLDAQKKSGLTNFVPCQWLMDNRVVFSARSGDTAHVFEIRLDPPSFLNSHWRLNSAQQRLTFSTAYDEAASLAGARPPGARRMVFSSETRSEEIWSADLDTNHPRLVTKLRPLTREGGFHTSPTVSEDGTKIAFISHNASNDEVWLMDVPTGRRWLLSNTISTKLRSRISPDGSQVYFHDMLGQPDCNTNDTCHGVYVVPASGGAPRMACEKCYSWVGNLSPDGKRLIDGAFSRPVSLVDLETGRFTPLLPGGKSYETPEWSHDGRWIAFGVYVRAPFYVRLYVAPYTPDHIVAEDTWIPVTDGSTVENNFSWSPDDNWLYAFSGRDKYPCLWAHQLDPRTKKPVAPPMPVIHLHTARFNNGEPSFFSIKVARDKIVFNRGEITGNIWMTELQDPK